MGLFSRKKESEEREELPPLRFPQAPPKARLPRYESEISPAEAMTIKEAVQPGLEIPIRKPKLYRPLPEEPEEPQALPRPMGGLPEETHISRGQSMFVKVERYRDAMNKIHHLKDKLGEAEKILRRLDELKREEDKELSVWHQDLENIKNQVLEVDKALFE